MTEQELRAKWDQLDARQRANEADVDQSRAKLLTASGLTQERIAAALKLSQAHVCHLLTFGRFLEYNPGYKTENTPLSGLNEKIFRKAWSKTDRKGKEQPRFDQAMEILKAQFHLDGTANVHRRQQRLVSALLAQRYADKGWVATTRILEECAQDGMDEIRLKDALKTIKDRNAADCWLEKKLVGPDVMVRIRKLPKKKALDAGTVTAFYERVMEEIKNIERLSKLPATNRCVGGMMLHASMVKKLVKELYEELQK